MQAFTKNITSGKRSKGDKLGVVDHYKIQYPAFRRNFYIEVPELVRMAEDEVAELRQQLDNVKVSSWADLHSLWLPACLLLDAQLFCWAAKLFSTLVTFAWACAVTICTCHSRAHASKLRLSI